MVRLLDCCYVAPPKKYIFRTGLKVVWIGIHSISRQRLIALMTSRTWIVIGLPSIIGLPSLASVPHHQTSGLAGLLLLLLKKLLNRGCPESPPTRFDSRCVHSQLAVTIVSHSKAPSILLTLSSIHPELPIQLLSSTPLPHLDRQIATLIPLFYCPGSEFSSSCYRSACNCFVRHCNNQSPLLPV